MCHVIYVGGVAQLLRSCLSLRGLQGLDLSLYRQAPLPIETSCQPSSQSGQWLFFFLKIPEISGKVGVGREFVPFLGDY